MQLKLKLLSTILAMILVSGPAAAEKAGKGYRWVPVSGTGTHYFTTAIIHSQEPTATGYIQRSTDIVELEGDLHGRVLYHPVSVFDFAAGTLVNTGHQVFSGTVRGAEPVLLFDDEFRFEVNLFTGETVGRIRLVTRLAGAKTRCVLDAFGIGSTDGGDARIAYTGWCKVKTKRR
ncbi:hypothetical protein [Thioalkalivibrio sp. XN8]|uniref:hypothetical protein n=1 Tax=Thioalkalivibrio sp. XN8 TaxID=2712863 RepID=UPI0013E9C3EA|nr:hypothetical protein [Thioalkalivibrio sp. XN8]NGP53402.1 hypothetical protein [Thioalkalivibrio sp. XN8]